MGRNRVSEVQTAESLKEPAIPLQEAIDFIADNLQDLFGRVDGEARVTLERLVSLLEEEELDDYGVLRPTLFAFITAFELIAGASLQMSAPLPRATPCTDDQGGLRFEWSRSAGQLVLVIPSHPGGADVPLPLPGERARARGPGFGLGARAEAPPARGRCLGGHKRDGGPSHPRLLGHRLPGDLAPGLARCRYAPDPIRGIHASFQRCR